MTLEVGTTTLNHLKILDVLPPFDLLTLPYSPELESQLEYRVMCTQCRQKVTVKSSALLSWNGCAHRQANNIRTSQKFHAKFQKMPSDSELRQWMEYTERHRKGKLDDTDMKKIIKRNPPEMTWIKKR